MGFILDEEEVIGKANRGIGKTKFMSRYVTRDVLDQMCKLYVRPHLDYGDVLYHQYDSNFSLSLITVLDLSNVLLLLQ